MRAPDLGGISVEDLRERIQTTRANRPGRKAKETWVPPEVDDFADGAVLAFDQTLTKTGVALVAKGSGQIRLWVADVLRPEKTGLKGFEDTFAKADGLHRLLVPILAKWMGAVEAVVHEMPAVQGYRLESSLMAAREIRLLMSPLSHIPLRMLSRNAVYATLTGGSSLEKKHMTAAVERLIPNEWRSNGEHTRRWNQDVHDAVGLGLKYLYDKKRAAQ